MYYIFHYTRDEVGFVGIMYQYCGGVNKNVQEDVKHKCEIH